jgi:hypothetical protein
MKRFAAAAAGWLTMSTLAGAGDATDRMSRLLPISPGTPIHLDATIADVAIAGSNRSDVQIDIERHAPTAADLKKFPVLVDARADGIHVSIVQNQDGRDPNLKSTIAIAVPVSARLEAIRVFEGRVRLSRVRSSCDVDLRRGAIDAVDLAGRVRLEAGIGRVDVRDSELTAGGMMRLRVFNGPLRVRFARPPASARILALTLNGSIASDIPLTMKDRVGPRFGETTLGSGDPVLSMDVVKGDIRLAVEKR